MTKGQRIKKLREAKGYTQEELAKRLNTSKQAIGKYEKEIVTNIPSDRLEAMALILDTTPEYILGWDEKYNAVETQKNNDIMADIIIRMQRDPDFFDVAQILYSYDSNKIAFVKQFLNNLNSLHK